MGREQVFNKISKTVYPRVLEIVKEIKNLKVSYSGLFKHVTDEYFEKYNDSWTIINGNSIDTNELKFFQCMIFQALKDCGFDYHDIQFADDVEDSELKNQTITYRKHRLLGDYKHWINNPCNVDDYRLPFPSPHPGIINFFISVCSVLLVLQRFRPLIRGLSISS